MKKFLNELRYHNRNMRTSTKIFLVIIAIYFLLSFRRVVGHNPYIFIEIVVLILSLLIHELAHGFVAYLCGDNTAKYYGRLSLNPLRHLDPLGTIFPILLMLTGSSFVFGWAKPVPINYRNLKYGRVGEFLVAIAGVSANILLAILGTLFIKYYPFQSVSYPLLKMVISLIRLNVLLAVFNIMPIPPLDGSRVVASLGNRDLREAIFHLDRYGILIILLLSWTGTLHRFIIPAWSFILANLDKIIRGSL